MIRATRLALATALALAIACPAAARGTDPVAADPAGAWSRFLADATYEQANGAYAALSSVGYDVKGVDADACRENRDTLDAAITRVPVGLALRHAGMLCAEARGDAVGAERHMAVLAALSRHALAAPGEGAWREPIRVVRPEDVEAYLAIRGYDARYAYYAALHPGRFFPFVAVGWDDEARVERHLEFDWVDVLASLRSESPFDASPFDRYLIGRGFVEAWAGDGDVAALDVDAMHSAWLEEDAAAKRDRLQAGAGRGGVLSAQSWYQLCASTPSPRCADGLVDAVLPLAEAGHALPRLVLAAAYLDGLGVPRDESAARRLFDSADRAWAGGGAAVQLAALLLAQQRPSPAWLDAALDAAAARGSAAARAFVIARRSEGMGKDARLEPGDRAFLEDPANNRRGQGLALLASLEQARAPQLAQQLRERAAAAGHAGSQRELAVQRLTQAATDAQALRWLQDAAHSDDAAAGRALAYRAMLAADWKAAEAWLLGPSAKADVDAQMMLAAIYAQGVEGVHGGPKEALESYELLAADVPAARRSFLLLLLDGPEDVRDVARARRLLEEAAAGGDTEAQMMLGGALVHGKLGPPDAAAGRRWWEKAIAAGSHSARSELAMWLHGNEASPAARARAVTLLREADRGGYREATNNLAWLLCVSEFDDVRDPAAGLDTAARLGAPEALHPGQVDTVAACHAATGDFEAAARLQARAIESLPAVEGAEAMVERMRGRLALYRDGKPYRERAGAQD